MRVCTALVVGLLAGGLATMAGARAQGVKPYLPAGFNPFFAPPEELAGMGLPPRPVQKPGENWDNYVARELGWEKVVFAYDKAHTPKPIPPYDCKHPHGDVAMEARMAGFCAYRSQLGGPIPPSLPNRASLNGAAPR